MKKYEYKFIKSKMKLGLDFDKKIAETQGEWNRLGQEGWKFCTWGNDVTIFMREAEG